MIKYKRNLPKGGASSLVLALGTFGFCAFGFYKLIMGNRQRRSVDSDAPAPASGRPHPPVPVHDRVWNREENDHRLAILPFLSAECDVRCGAPPDRAAAPATRPRPSPPLSSGSRCTARAHRSAYLKQVQTEKEKELMEDVPDWEAGANIYNTTYLRPMDLIGRIKLDLYKD